MVKVAPSPEAEELEWAPSPPNRALLVYAVLSPGMQEPLTCCATEVPGAENTQSIFPSPSRQCHTDILSLEAGAVTIRMRCGTPSISRSITG